MGATVGMLGWEGGESEMGGQPCMIVCSLSQGGTVGMVGVSQRWGDSLA